MRRDEIIRNMRARAHECRSLANLMSSPVAKKALLQMADETEADIEKIEARLADAAR